MKELLEGEGEGAGGGTESAPRQGQRAQATEAARPSAGANAGPMKILIATPGPRLSPGGSERAPGDQNWGRAWRV
jgi:hypothetical protein